MTTSDTTTDPVALATIGERLAQIRLQRNTTQAQLAREAGISKRTLVRLEAGESSQLINLIRVARALGLLGNLDAFIPPPSASPIEQLRMRTKKRRRASPRAPARPPVAAWTWGDSAPRDDNSSHGEGAP